MKPDKSTSSGRGILALIATILTTIFLFSFELKNVSVPCSMVNPSVPCRPWSGMKSAHCLKLNTTKVAVFQCRSVFDEDLKKARLADINFNVKRCCIIKKFRSCVIKVAFEHCSAEDRFEMVDYLVYGAKILSGIPSTTNLKEVCAESCDGKFYCIFSGTVFKVIVAGSLFAVIFFLIVAILILKCYSATHKQTNLPQNANVTV